MRVSRRPSAPIVIAVVAVTGLSACSASTGHTAGDTSQIVIAVPAEPDTLGSYQAATPGTYGVVLRNIEEPLVDRDPADPTTIVPVLAESWTRTSDTTIEFTLRQGITFTDGSPFNAQDAAFSINLVWDKDKAYTEPATYEASQISATAVSDYVVDVSTAKPDPLLLNRLPAAVMTSKAQYDADPTAFEASPIGTGPYEFVDWVKGQYIDVKRNPGWWGADPRYASLNLGTATYDTAKFIFRPDAASRVNSLLANESEIATTIDAATCQKALTNRCVAGTISYIVMFRPDIKFSQVLSNAKVREALSIAIDRESIANTLYVGGQAISQMAWPGITGYDDSLKPADYSLDQAKQLLSQAQAEGVDLSTPLHLIGRADQAGNPKPLGEFIQNAWQQLGLNVDLQMVDSSEWLKTWVTTNVSGQRDDIEFTAATNYLYDLSRVADTFLTCKAVASAVCDSDLDSSLASAEVLDGPAREDALKSYNDTIATQNIVIPVVAFGGSYGISTGIDWKPRQDAGVYLREMKPKA